MKKHSAFWWICIGWWWWLYIGWWWIPIKRCIKKSANKDENLYDHYTDANTWRDPSHDPEMKPKSERQQYHDNLNHMMFKGEGIFSTTGRKRTIQPMKAFSYEQAYNALIDNGFLPDSLKIERCCPEPPTKAQLVAMREHKDFIPENMCKEDASCIIERYAEMDNFAGKEFLNFATAHGLYISYYIGQYALAYYLWDNLNDEEKVALYMVCIKRNVSGKWYFNNFDTYKTKTHDLLINETFLNSFKRINADNILPDDISDNTNCYKMAQLFI